MNEDDFYSRVGVAFTRPKGPTQRRNEYEILETPWGEQRVRYVGYREQKENGEVLVGLPLAGPHASWAQPVIKFYPNDYEEVRFFKKGKTDDK
jgi:hypothetical protein